jgi:hypothetical protein
MIDDKPRLIPISPPADIEAVRADLGQPFPLNFGSSWYALADDWQKMVTWRLQ